MLVDLEMSISEVAQMAGFASQLSESEIQALAAWVRTPVVPAPRWGEAEEVGRCVATMAAGDLPYTVGHSVLVDGGLALPRL